MSNEIDFIKTDAEQFALVQRKAIALSRSTMVPKQYQGENGTSNCIIAMEIAQRSGMGILATMQNLYIIEGKPSWASNYVMTAIGGCGKFEDLEYEYKDIGKKNVEHEYYVGYGENRKCLTGNVDIHDKSCVAWAPIKGHPITSEMYKKYAKHLKDSGTKTLREFLKTEEGLPIKEGPTISIEMAVKEGWYTKKGSKWKTMPELMLKYRAAAFFGRTDEKVNAVLFGLHTVDEITDMVDVTEKSQIVVTESQNELADAIEKAKSGHTDPVENNLVQDAIIDSNETPSNIVSEWMAPFLDDNEEKDSLPL